ncbi:glycosyl hydrolase [Enterococcus sp. JM9B]|uniref:glycoside hydrolase family 38 N-terminal domain-containing protein n=1 Tax=Enterococcus sp. JM9B TaxID=1857216 RepID=UPI001374A9F5|nr:glycosyl hydrolase [Enterococcus sp. JM9B]KAF1300881.1 hypothetical protein BAU16_10900 [Enterococcus sp. JM9B]
MKNKFKIYLISHSHTDIGYTDRQEKIERYHVDFIKQVIALNRAIDDGKHPEWKGFKWTCENFWQVENFLNHSNDTEKKDFYHYVATGRIDVSLNYLNMTELVDSNILEEKLTKGVAWAKKIGFTGRSAMTADVNGYSWGYSTALYRSGIRNLFSCVHGHHGLAPLRYQQRPFKWQTPEGEELFVWNGGHYMLGNEFLLIPNTRFTYHLKDEFENRTDLDQREITHERIYRYVNSLKASGYVYDYVPIMISGVLTDNAPANGQLMESIQWWNENFGTEIELEMKTLTEFFEIAKKEDVPVYTGDWNDWWADGVGSTPTATKIYKDAQRKYHLVDKLEKQTLTENIELREKAQDNLMMYAEHTWGYSSSISEPWNTLVNDLEYRKTGYATQAHVAISKALDNLLAEQGEVSISPNRKKLYKIINPHLRETQEIATVLVEHWEDIEGSYINAFNIKNIVAIDTTTNEELPTQAQQTARATEVKVLVKLKAEEKRIIQLKLVDEAPQLYDLNLIRGSEGIQDIQLLTNQPVANNWKIENNIWSIDLDHTEGIKNITLRAADLSILHSENIYAPFVGIYEKTPVRTNPVEERRLMGRNRKGIFVERSAAKLKNMEIIEDGQLFTGLLLDFQLLGTEIYSVYLKVYKLIERIDATIRIHKQSIWSPENIYVSLPFKLPDAECYVDKSGCMIRPGIDQLPGTNMEFYLTQNGITYNNQGKTLMILCQDAPLVTFGELDAHEIRLSNGWSNDKNQEVAYSWVMNNFWETNFKADLGGFYEFNYSINLFDAAFDVATTKELMAEQSQGIIGVPI